MINEQEINNIVNKQHVFFNSGITQVYDFRLKCLQRLKNGLKQYQNKLHAALKDDLGKSEFESYASGCYYFFTFFSNM